MSVFIFKSTLVLFFFLFVVQCTPTRPSASLSRPSAAVRLPSPSPSSGGSLCYFKCPDKDLKASPLDIESSTSGVLSCTYPLTQDNVTQYNCKYNKSTGLLNDPHSSQCPGQGVFYCPGTRNGKRVTGKRFVTRSEDLPQFVKARSARDKRGIQDKN